MQEDDSSQTAYAEAPAMLTGELAVQAGAGGLAAGGVHGPLGHGDALQGTTT